MKSAKINYIVRKKELVIKNYETAFTSYFHHSTEINSRRSWCITLLIGYVGLIITLEISFSNYLFIIGYFIILSFMILEIIECLFLIYLDAEIRNIERIFMIKQKKHFNEEIENYIFRNSKIKKKSKMKSIRNLGKIINNNSFILWYTFIVASFFFIFYFLI